nr:dexh-box atp-dependent rna helicase dexh18, mitochondrial [Quercus suber]
MLKPSGEELHRRSSLVLTRSRSFISRSKFCPTPSDVPNRPFSTFAFTLFHLLAPFKIPLQPLKFKASATFYAKPFSSSSAPNGDDDHGVSSLTMVESESECDFDVDVGKSIVGLLHSLDDDDNESYSTVSDSTMVELGNDTNEEGIVVDSMVASDNNDDVGLERCEGHLNVASRDPVEVYRSSIIISVAQIKLKPLKTLNLRLYWETKRESEKPFMLKPSDVPNRPFSTSAFTLFHLLAPFKFPLQPLKFKASATLYAKPFSSSSAPNGDDDHGVSSLTMVESESECDFDVDVGKSIVGLLHSLDDDDDESYSTVSDSTMVELGNDTNEEGIVVDSTVASDNNDDVGLERCEGHLNVASRDPVEVYRELRNVEKVQKFWNFFFKKCSANVFKYVVSLGPSDDAVKSLFPIFVEYCLKEFPDEIKRFWGMIESADLTKPHTWFPFAWAMKWKIIYHCGPTNSGETYNALQQFMEAKNGIYCSPLRLLAMEVFDKVNALGVYCTLLTS